MDSSQSSTPITLITKEGERFNVSGEVISGSKLLKMVLADADTPTPEFNLPFISAPILPFILEYLSHYSWQKTDPPTVDPDKPLENFNMEDYFPRWECNYADKPPEDLCELLVSAEYLGISGLRELIATKMASMVNGKSEDEVKEAIKRQRQGPPEDPSKREAESKRINDMIARATKNLEEQS